MLSTIVGVVLLLWSIGVALIGSLGSLQIFRYYRRRPATAACERLPLHDVPHITIIRPVKGLEPDLYRCLAATFQQTYPRSKLTIFLCVTAHDDPALPTLEALVRDHPDFDVHLTIDEEDEVLQARKSSGQFGPNPKIGNISRAYREAKGDIIWILDCNVWVGRGVAGRLIHELCGFGGNRPYKFVHQLPLVVDITRVQEQQGLLSQPATISTSASSIVSPVHFDSAINPAKDLRLFGGRLDETFLTSAHAKFYTAINTLAIAPCILGKSNMFRRSHLNALTDGQGTDFVSYNICEDHLIGDLLWRRPVPAGMTPSTIGSGRHVPDSEDGAGKRQRWGNHGLVLGDLAIQPIASMSLAEYIARRVRWLRVRKFTVTLATLVEPGTESFLCSAYLAYAVTTLPWFADTLGIPGTWTAFAFVWLLSVSVWATADRLLYNFLMSMGSTEVDQNTPAWARGTERCEFMPWLCGWLGREALALPIWLWAVWGGVTVVWRGSRFRVGMDMKVTALDPEASKPAVFRRLSSRSSTPLGRLNGSASKTRRE